MAAQHGRFHLHRGSEGLQFEWRFFKPRGGPLMSAKVWYRDSYGGSYSEVGICDIWRF